MHWTKKASIQQVSQIEGPCHRIEEVRGCLTGTRFERTNSNLSLEIWSSGKDESCDQIALVYLVKFQGGGTPPQKLGAVPGKDLDSNPDSKLLSRPCIVRYVRNGATSGEGMLSNNTFGDKLSGHSGMGD